MIHQINAGSSMAAGLQQTKKEKYIVISLIVIISHRLIDRIRFGD